MMHINLVTLLGFLLIGAVEPARKPSTPPTLRQLYVQADLVVVAKAGKAKDLKPAQGPWYKARVDLSVERTVKGEARGAPITVFFARGVTCPQPERYPEDTSILAFLSWDEKVNAYHAWGLSYGSKVLPAEDLKVYVARLEALARLPEKAQKDPQCPEIVEWLVRCMEHPATRWEGAFEFDALVYGGVRRSERMSPRVPLSRLSPEQLKRLTDSFLKKDEVSEADLELASVLEDVVDPRIDKLLVKGLRTSIDSGDSWAGERFARVIADRLKSDAVVSQFKPLHDLRDLKDNQARTTILEEFLKLVGK